MIKRSHGWRNFVLTVWLLFLAWQAAGLFNTAAHKAALWRHADQSRFNEFKEHE
jgi:hypothetical protein